MALIPLPKVARERYGRHPRTIHRWATDPKYAALNFPKLKTINGRNHCDEAELDAFDRTATSTATDNAA
jgi:hypothetical protein